MSLRSYILPNKSNLSISVLRKNHDKHDIVRSDSGTHKNYVGAALNTSAHTTIKNTNHNFHKLHQVNVYNHILTSKGYTKNQFTNALKKVNKTKSKQFKMQKNFGGKITFDPLSNLHNYIKNLLIISELPNNFSLPITVGGKKIKNYVFSKRVFYNKLKNLHESKVII